MNLHSISAAFILDKIKVGAVAIKDGTIAAISGSTSVEGASGPPPVASLLCFCYLIGRRGHVSCLSTAFSIAARFSSKEEKISTK